MDVLAKTSEPATPYRVPVHNRLLRALIRPVFRLIFYAVSRVVITGLENVPREGPYLIAINHTSLFEAPLMAAFWPVVPEAAGAAEIWERGYQGILARAFGGIKVHRHDYDRKMLTTLLNVLASGYPLLIAPEGTRSHTPGMQRAEPGIGYLVDRAGVPVVPVGVVGSTDDFLKRGLRGERPQIEMHIGEPMQLTPITAKGAERRRMRQHNADHIMYRIAELMPPEYQGVYNGDPLPDV